MEHFLWYVCPLDLCSAFIQQMNLDPSIPSQTNVLNVNKMSSMLTSRHAGSFRSWYMTLKTVLLPDIMSWMEFSCSDFKHWKKWLVTNAGMICLFWWSQFNATWLQRVPHWFVVSLIHLEVSSSAPPPQGNGRWQPTPVRDGEKTQL